MTIIDSSIWIDYLADVSDPHTAWLDQTIERNGRPDRPSLREILQGIRCDREMLTARREIKKFIIFDSCGEALAFRSATDYRSLRAKGCTIRKTIDCLIATFCLHEGHTLLHRDRNFDLFEQHLGLNVVHPQS